MISTTAEYRKFRSWMMFLLGYTLLVILWGAWVRISHSGDGCGETWPLCQGQMVPVITQVKTWIELSHRLSSGLFGIFVLATFIYARRNFAAGSWLRRLGTLSLIFTISEALLGAKLVIFGLVSNNDSPFRAIAMSLHFINSLLLVGSLALLWDFSRPQHWVRRASSPWLTSNLKIKTATRSVVFCFIAIGASGTVAALSSTLFPSQSLLQGVFADFAADSHYLVRLRGIHPFLGLFVGGGLALAAWISCEILEEQEAELRTRSVRFAIFTGIGVFFGAATLLALYPVWMKLTHLALAHLIWIHIVLWVRSLLLVPATQ